jgi:hypothetical protein
MVDEKPEFKQAQKYESVAGELRVITDEEWPLYRWLCVDTHGNPVKDVYVRGERLPH